MFEQASRIKLRFKATTGSFSAEDLWDFSLTALDTMAKSLRKEVEAAGDESFITANSKTAEAARNELRFSIVKHVITTLLAEKQAKADSAKKSAQKAQLLEALESKKSEAIRNMSVEDIQKQLEAL